MILLQWLMFGVGLVLAWAVIAQAWVSLDVLGLAGGVFAVVATSVWLMRFTRVPGLGGGLLTSAIANGTMLWIFSRGLGP